MDKYYVTRCFVGGRLYSFVSIAANPEDAERNAAIAAYNYYHFRLAVVTRYTEEITEKEYNEL